MQTATYPSTNQLRKIGRYMQQTDPVHAAELIAEIGDINNQADLGRYYFECDSDGFWASLEHAR